MNPETLRKRIEAAASRQCAALAAERECLAKARTWQERAVAAKAEYDWLVSHPDAPVDLVPAEPAESTGVVDHS